MAVKKEEEGDEKSEKDVESEDTGELCNSPRLQGDAKDEISEEEATLVRTDEEEERARPNIFDEQLGQFSHSQAGEPGKKEAAENEVDRGENSQLLKEIGLQVIKSN